MTSLPPKTVLSELTDEELVALIQSFNTKAESVLITRYTPFVKHLAGNYFGFSLETDDIVQEGMLALLSAAYSYSSHKNAAFRTYSAVCITNRLRSVIKAEAAQRNVPLNTYIPLDDIDDTVFHQDLETGFISDENAKLIINCIDKDLSPLEASVLRCFLADKTYRQTAEKLGVNDRTVGNALQRIRAKLRKAMNESWS